MISNKAEYNSLQDAHLAHHFRKPTVFRHLLCMGLVTPEGKVLSDREWKNYQRFTPRDAFEEQRTPRLLSLASEGNLRPPQQGKRQVISNKRRNFSSKEICLPFPFFAKRKGVLGEPYLDSLTPFRSSNASKVYSIRSAGGARISKCSQVWERLCPPPNYNVCNSSWRKIPPISAYFKLRYLGKTGPTAVLILQQPSGVNSVPIFNGTVRSGEEFDLTSCRSHEASFSLIVYENGLCTCRVNTCCERRYYPGRRIGGPGGHFLVVHVNGGAPCGRCGNATSVDSMKFHSRGNARKPIGAKITVDVELAESGAETSSPNSEEKPKGESGRSEDSAEDAKYDYDSDSPTSSNSDSKSGVNEAFDDHSVDDEAVEVGSVGDEVANEEGVDDESDEDDNYKDSDDDFEEDGSGTGSDSHESGDSRSHRSDQSEAASSSGDSVDESEPKPERESNGNDPSDNSYDDDANLKTSNDSKTNDYSSDFNSSHSTTKEQTL